MQGIYKFTCKINNKVYIGQSVNIENRFKSHLSNYNNKNLKDYNTKFYRALRKYGISNFSFEIIEEVKNKELLNSREIFWISYFDSFKNGYNSTQGGGAVTENCELHPNAKNSNKRILQLKELLLKTEISQYELAKNFNITQSEVSNINQGKKWSSLGNYEYPIRKNEARLKGEANPKAVLTDEMVNTIRQRYVNEIGREIYKDYQQLCSYTTFERALLGKTYSYLPIYKKKEKKWIQIFNQSCIDYP